MHSAGAGVDPDHTIAQVRSRVPGLLCVAMMPNELLKGVDALPSIKQWIQTTT